MPANTLLGWQAYFSLKAEKSGVVVEPTQNNVSSENIPQSTNTSKSIEQQCSDVMKMIGR